MHRIRPTTLVGDSPRNHILLIAPACESTTPTKFEIAKNLETSLLQSAKNFPRNKECSSKSSLCLARSAGHSKKHAADVPPGSHVAHSSIPLLKRATCWTRKSRTCSITTATSECVHSLTYSLTHSLSRFLQQSLPLQSGSVSWGWDGNNRTGNFVIKTNKVCKKCCSHNRLWVLDGLWGGRGQSRNETHMKQQQLANGNVKRNAKNMTIRNRKRTQPSSSSSVVAVDRWEFLVQEVWRVDRWLGDFCCMRRCQPEWSWHGLSEKRRPFLDRVGLY